MLNIALFGPPGAGKGTQSKMLVEKYNLMYISTGDLLRQEIAASTEIGLRAKDVIEKGGLASDEIIMEIIENRIKMNPDAAGILFDGFPRTVVQAYILDGLMERMQSRLICMLALDVPKVELKKRLLARAKIDGRSDDKEEVIQYRLQEYENKTLAVARFYAEKGKYFPIDGVGDVNQIFDRLTEVIEQEAGKIWINVVLSGYPGAGKNLYAEFMEEKYGLVKISTGRLIRAEIEKDTEMGRIAKPYMERGDIVPDEIAIRLIEQKIRNTENAKGFIFKGFPSNFVQAYILDGLLKKMGASITCVIHVNASPLQCLKRLAARGKTDKARVYDKDHEVIIHRLEVHEKNWPKIQDYYQKQNLLYTIEDVDKPQITREECYKVVDKSVKKIK